MSGYNYSNWGRRRRDCGSQGGSSNQNTGYWNSHYNTYGNYNQYHYPQLTFSQQWNSVHWNEPNQYGGTYGREQVTHDQHTPQHSVIPTKGHNKAVKVNTLQSRGGKRKQEHSSFLSRNNPPLQWRGTRKSPPLGSEEARKKTLAQATDKIKTCLLSFQDEKSEVLENLLSSKDHSVAELSKASCVRLEKSDYAELQLTPSDLKVIGMVTTSGTGPSTEMDEAGSYTVENISTNELGKLSGTAEIAAPISTDLFCTFNRQLVDNVDRDNMCGSLEREKGLQDSSKSIGPKPYCIYEQRITSEINYQGKPTVGDNQTSHSDSCAQSGAASLDISDAVDDCNKHKGDTNKNTSYEHVSLKQKEPKETLKKLKHRIIQQFLKMGKNNLKDLINNPRSRKFEFAMNHLMKEHRLLLSRELRGLAQSRIRGQDIETLGRNEAVRGTSSLLDADIEINLSHLPQEVIEQLGSLLQLDLLDNAESIDFQPITDDCVGSVHDLQNIQALQVALLSEENIKKEGVESEIKPLVTREDGSNAVVESGGGTHLMEDQHVPDSVMNSTLMDEGTGQTEVLQRREVECEQALIFDESAKARDPGKVSDEWPNYSPLREEFMNRSSDFGNIVPEYPDIMNVESIEFGTVDGKNKNMSHIPCTRQTNREADGDHNLETDQNHPRSSDKLMNVDVASEASEAHVSPSHEMSDHNPSQVVYGMASEILNTDIDISSDKPLSNSPVEFTTTCVSGCDLMESHNEDIRIDTSQREGFDSLRNTGIDISDNIHTSDVETDFETKDMAEDYRDAVEPREVSAVTDGSECSTAVLADKGLLQDAAADELLEGSRRAMDTNYNLIGITEGLTAATFDTDLGKNEMKADSEMSKERRVISIIDRASEPSERLNCDPAFDCKHTENLQANLNTCDSDKNLNLQTNINEENSYGIENETFNKEVDINQVESSGTEVGDLSSKSVGVSVVLHGSNNEDTNCDEDSMADTNSIHSAIAEHNIHSCVTAETAKSCVFNETEIAPSGRIQGSVSVDGPPHVHCDISVAEDNLALGETQVGDSGDHGNDDVTHIPIFVETEKDGNGLSILKRCIPDKEGPAANSSLAAGVGIELTSSNVTSQHETHDNTVDTCYCNVVVKTEKIDDMTNDETIQTEEQAEHEDASTIFPEPQTEDSLSHTQSSVICNPTKKVTTVEVGTQAELSEELHSYNVQKILQLLQKSHHLSPQLAKSLKEYLSSVQVTESCESVCAKNLGATSVSKEKSPPSLIIHPLSSKVLQSPQAHISKIHDMDSPMQTSSLQHTSKLSHPTDGMGYCFRGPSLNGDVEKNRNKRIKLAKPDDTSPELGRVKKVGGGSKDNEGLTCVSDLGVADTSNPSVGIARCPCIEDDLNGDGINHFNTEKSVQESSLSSNTQNLFLKMLEIDKEIQKLMETKLKLYTKLQLSFTSCTMCTNVDNRQSLKSAGLKCASPTKVLAPDMLCNNVRSGSSSDIQPTHTGFVTVNRNRSISSSCAGDTATCASNCMVILPLDYALGSSTDLQNTHISVPKNGLSESMKTVDTSPVEGININICNCQISEEVSAMAHSSGHSDQSENACGNEAPSLKLGLHQVNSSGSNNVRRYLAPHISDCCRESDQSERNSVPKAVNVNKGILKPKCKVSKEECSSNKNNEAHKQHSTGISMGNESCRAVDNQDKDGAGSICETTTRKPLCSDSLLKTAVKELRSRNKHTIQKVGNMKCEQEFSRPGGNIIVQDRKDTVSPFSTKVLTRNNKQPENDSSNLRNTSTRHSQRKQNVNKSNEQLSSQTTIGVLGHRGDTKIRSCKDIKIKIEGISDMVGRKKKMQSHGRKIMSLGESELPDCLGRVTRKRKLSVTRDIVGDDCIADSQGQPVESRGRSFSRTADLQEIQPHVMDKNAADMSTRMKRRVAIEQTNVVDECNSPASQLQKTVVSHSGYLQMRCKPKVQSSPKSLTSDLSSRTKQHVDGVEKRKSLEREDPPIKVQCLDPKLNPLQWKLHDCFVMVKPLAVEEIGNTNKLQEEFTTADSQNKQKISRSSSSSPELSVANFVKIQNKRTESKRSDLTDKWGDHCRVIYPELVGTELDEIEGCSSQQDPLGDIPSAQAHVSEVSIQPSESITSSPLQLPCGLIVQPHSSKPKLVMERENTVSTLVYDTSDGEQEIARKDDEKSEAGMRTCNTDKDDCDQDSACSDDTGQEDREGTNTIKASKLRSSKRHKKDRKSDGIERLVFESHEGPVLDIKTVGRHVLAASEDGSVYCYSLKSGKFKRKFEGHNGAITCLCVIECSNGNVNSDSEVLDAEQLSPDSFFTGSLDRHLRSFRFKTGELVHSVDVGSPIQCMDHNCGIIYVGTRTGYVSRYNVKTSSLIGEPTKIGRESILTLKATKEGPRQVLIIGSRNKPIAVRDAATGLLLRTVCNSWSHTVYSLAVSTNIVYCGTKTGNIPAFVFTSGDEVCRYRASSGVVCLRLYNNLLFAGCYDGNIYVFSVNDKTQVAHITGPGKMLLCMDIVKNRIIAGSKDGNKLEAWGFPQQIRNHLKEAKHK